MAELTMLRLTLLLLAVGCISAKRFAIMAPNVFHIGVKEQVSIAVFDAGNPVNVKLYLQDYPHRKKTFSQVQGRVGQGSNIFLPVKVEPENLPDTSSVDKQYVYLVAKSDDGHFQFHKEAKILLSYKDGMVFIQTDKPIYTPRQSVKIRVFPLEFDMKPSQRKITVVVMNPQGIRVQQWKDLDTSTGIISKRLDLDDFILMGNWTITAVYGHQDTHNTSVQFEVKEYVLPKFSVKLKAPHYILKTDNLIKINITTRYTYGTPVIGSAAVHLSIAGRNGQNVPFARHNIELDSSGVTTLTERIRIIQELPGNLWFPEDSRLQIQADVIERATGNKESALDKSCKFTSSPYLIEFKNTATYFKPGLRFVVKVVVTYPNKQPARNVPMLISAKGKQANGMVELRKFDKDPNVRDSSNKLGEAEFVVDACSNCEAITIEVRTDNEKLDDSQNAVAKYVVKPFDAENGPLIMVRQLTPGKVGRKIQCESYRSRNDGATKLSFAVVSRGRILSHNTTDPFDGMFRSWSFRITSQMSPSARLIGYYIDNTGRVVADSILLKVEDTLPTTVDFPDAFKDQVGGPRVQLNEVEKRPGTQYTLKVKAPQGTRLGLLSVDQSIYLLRNENRLTKERIFKTAEALDLGCGVGGGKNSKDIFKNAGVVLMTENFVSDGRTDYGCGDGNSRKKRSAADDEKMTKICCDMAKDIGNTTCAKMLIHGTKGLDPQCRVAFSNCCRILHGMEDTALLGRSGGDIGDFGPSDEEILDQTQVRSFFPETWIYDEKVVGPGGLVTMDVTIPDTITTWVMQAVAINNKTGLGLATPLRIVARREYFVTLNMPYSVKRGEQVSLLATVFNNHENEMRAKFYLTGNKDICSVAADRERAWIGTVDVPSKDAKSVAVPIVPKRIGEVEIKVSTIVQMNVGSQEKPIYMNIGGDAVRRKLLVVPEGKEHRKSQSFILDPMGNLKDSNNNGGDKAVKPTTASFKSKKIITSRSVSIDIDLESPVKAIPGSVGAFVYLTGNLLGPVVNTTIEGGLDKYFRQPTGCGEQTMIYLAPNVYVLKYLMETKQLSGANEENAYRFIQSGYARELNYRRDDKSFSAWGNRRPGSTWLTAFVMRVFCEAKKFSGVNIDENLVCESVAWLIQNQKASGALPEAFAVAHTEMVGGAYTEGEVAMTAFVLSTLAECKCSGVNSEAAILRAKSFLEGKYSNLNKPYSMALTAYALSLVDSTEKLNANDRLVQNAVYDSTKQSRYWNAGGNALNVETAGYALLTQMILGRTGYAGPIVTYLTNQRKGGVGFVSTQDTVVALQALAFYSEKSPNGPTDLRVNFASEMDNEWKPPEMHITQENALLRRQIDVENYLGGVLTVTAQGNGIGLLEVEVRYNLPTTRDEICKFDVKTTVKEIKEQNPEDPFAPVQAEPNDEPKQKGGKKKKGGKNRKGCDKPKNKNKKRCKKPKKPTPPPTRPPPKHQPVKSIHLKVCTRYREVGNTGMSIMDIGILTGFKPDQKSLKKLQDNLPELDNYEVSDSSLVIYLSEISDKDRVMMRAVAMAFWTLSMYGGRLSTGRSMTRFIPSDRELCVDVQFDREYYVGVVQAVPVNVYDYYEPDESCSKFYGPDKHSPLNLGVCDIGSASCKCTQDECAQQDPPIGDINKLIREACNKYNYVIKGKVLLIDEQNTMLAYVVEVVRIIKRGTKRLKVGNRIELWKRGACQSPDLKEDNEYLFMGLDSGDRYDLDKNSFVKLWPKIRDNNQVILNDFANQFACP